MYKLYDANNDWRWTPFTGGKCKRWFTQNDTISYGEWHIGTGYGNDIGPNEDQIKIVKCQEYAECKIDFGIDERITQSCEPFPGFDDSYGCKR